MARALYPAHSPVKLEPAPMGQLCSHYPHGGWAELRDRLGQKLCCRPEGCWKQLWRGSFPRSPNTWPPCQSLFRPTVFLTPHRLLILMFSETHTQYFCSSREILPQPLLSQACCAPVVLSWNVFYEYVQTAGIFSGWSFGQVLTDMSCMKWWLVSPIHSTQPWA